MKRSVFRLLTNFCVLISITAFASAVLAQGHGNGNGNGNGGGNNGGGGDPPPTVNVGYRIHWEFGPEETIAPIAASDNAIKTDSEGVPIAAFVVGYYSRVDRDGASAFAYVMGNPANPNDNQANRFWDIEELVGPTPSEISWATTESPISNFASNFRGVNADGLITGYVMDPQGTRRGVYLDLSEVAPELHLIPEPPNSYDRYEGEDVSSTGDILVHYRTPEDSNGNVLFEAYVFRPSTGEVLMIEDANSGQPIQFVDGRFGIHLNSTGQIVGQRADGMAVRHFLDSGITAELPDVQVEFGDNLVNDSGQVATTRSFSTNNRKRGRTEGFAVRIGADDSVEWVSSNRATGAWTMNNQGDVIYFDNYPAYYFNESLQQAFFIGDLIISESDPNGWFTGYESTQMRLTEVDQTGFGWLTPAVSSSSGGIAILIPEILP